MQDATRPVRMTRLGGLAIVAAVLGWTFTNLILKITKAPALTFAFYRLWGGAAIMVVALLVSRRRVTWAMVKASAPGGVCLALDIALFFSALKATNLADVLIIQALQPALVLMVAGRFFGERITPYDVSWTLVSVGGVIVVTVGSSGTPVWSLRGDVYAVGALFVWTAYFLVSKRVRRRVPATEYMSIVTVVAAVVITPITLASGQPLGALRIQDWGWLGIFLIAGQGGHFLLAWAHSQVDVSISSLLMLMQPVVAVGAAYFILNEPIRALEIVGGIIVIAAVAAIVRRASKVGESEGLEELSTADTAPT